MKDEDKTKAQLINNLMALRERLAELEKEKEERKRAEEVSREAEKQLRLTFNAVPAMIWQKDLNGKYMQVNKAYCQTIGCPEKDIVGKTDYDLFPDEIAAQYANADWRILKSGIPEFSLEEQHQKPSGKRGWSRTDKMVYYDAQGRIAGTIGFALDITDQKRLEEALRESEERCRQILENITEVFWMADVELTKMIYISSAYEEVWGRTCASLYANPKSWIEGVHPDDREKVNSAIVDRLTGGYRVEYRVVRPDGSVRWVLDRGFPIRNQSQEVYRVAGIAEDISRRKRTEEELARYRDHLEELVRERTAILAKVNDQMTYEIEERQKAERALKESQQMLQSVLDTIPVRVFWKNLDSKYLGCNRAFALDAGLHSPDQILGKDDFEMIWAEQAELFRADDRLVMGTGKPKLAYEEPQTTLEGDRIWLLTNKVPLLDTEGRIKGVLGTYEDITKIKQMEEALRASKTKYRIVADNTYDWEYWISAEGEFLYTSPSCQRITGYAASEFETHPKLLSRIVHPDDLTRFEAHLNRHKATCSSSQLEFRIIHRDGMTRWIGHLCQPVFDAEGRFLGRRGSNRDISDQKEAEKALQESSQKLKLFAYSVAHDLKSPAIGIYGLSSRLAKSYRDILDEKGRSYCDQILRAAEHIAALVDKVNVYIATKEARLSIETIDITDILRVLKDEFSALLSIRQIDWLESGTTVQIKADRLCILRAFRNFVDNSLKYGGERLSKIRIAYEESEDFHIFSFSDNGRGLQEEDSGRIFRAFQRNETSRGVEGAGLGLAIIKEIAEQHGGKAWIEPRTEKGITFYISISKNL